MGRGRNGLAVAAVVALLVCFHAIDVAAHTPVVLMHGINADPGTVSHIRDLLVRAMPGIYVRALSVENARASIFTSMEDQVAIFCEDVASDPKLAGGMNIIGVSQGGVLSRGYIERCNNPPTKVFVSWLGPQMGVYGVPNVGHIEYVNVTLDAIADCCIYDEWAQDLLSFAGYWRDPFALDTYRKYCKYLPDINNDRPVKNPIYKQRFSSLENLVLVYSTGDEVLIPRETSWFGSYAPNSDTVIVPMEQSDIYKEDWIGLKKLNDTGRLHKVQITCSHTDQYSPCFDNAFLGNVLPFLVKS